MKAVYCTKYGPPEVLQLVDVEKPAPRDNEVLIKVRATTVHIGDTKVRRLEPGLGPVRDFFFKPLIRIMLGFKGPRNKILGMELRTWKAATRNPIDAFFLIGSVLAITGLIIRVTSILQLKQHFTYTVTKIKNHELIETGLYRIIRHPGYLGQLIIFLGISICLSNWLSILLMIIPVLLGYLNRINVEEKFMVVQLGQKYIDYRKRTKRLIPMIY